MVWHKGKWITCRQYLNSNFPYKLLDYSKITIWSKLNHKSGCMNLNYILYISKTTQNIRIYYFSQFITQNQHQWHLLSSLKFWVFLMSLDKHDKRLILPKIYQNLSCISKEEMDIFLILKAKICRRNLMLYLLNIFGKINISDKGLILHGHIVYITSLFTLE